jgi:molybdate transport system permease protein
MRRVKGLLGGLLRAGSLVSAGLLVAFLALPPLALVLRVSPLSLLSRLAAPEVLEALRLSLVTSVLATAVVLLLGIPLAYFLVARPFPARRLVEALVDLPMVLPPTVAGAGLLFACGRAGLLGGALHAFGVTLPFSTAAVVMAQAFVAAPFFVSTFVAGLRAVEPRYVEVAATLRAPPGAVFLRVMLPLSSPSLLAGAGMCWARALGEFGATITFAGNLPGVTRTLPLAVYTALQSDLEAAVALAVVLLAVSFVVLLGLRLLPAGLLSGGRARASRAAG